MCSTCSLASLEITCTLQIPTQLAAINIEFTTNSSQVQFYATTRGLGQATYACSQSQQPCGWKWVYIHVGRNKQARCTCILHKSTPDSKTTVHPGSPAPLHYTALHFHTLRAASNEDPGIPVSQLTCVAISTNCHGTRFLWPSRIELTSTSKAGRLKKFTRPTRIRFGPRRKQSH